MPTTILASRYNALRDQVNLVLGSSSAVTPTYGYGQNFSTNSVIGTRSVADPSNADKVSAQNYEDLYIDLIRTRAHQVGAAVTINDFVIGDYETNTETADKIEETYIQGLESVATNIITDRLVAHPDNLRLTSLPTASSSRPSSTTWSTVISHIFTITFASEIARRHFFNAGGEVRLSASVDYTGSQSKTVDWQTILNAMGTISFKAEETISNAGVGSGTSIGNYDLTSTYKQIYSRTGGAVYARNRYNISALSTNATTIQFKVEFIDGLPNNITYGIDEVVFGTFNSNVDVATPDGEININGTLYPTVTNISDPVGAIVRSLS